MVSSGMAFSGLDLSGMGGAQILARRLSFRNNNLM
jgi:hypothetical protein